MAEVARVYPFAPDPARGTSFARVYSGRVWHFYSPDPEAVTLIDVAHHLAHKCRWFGAMRVIYTVAQHAVLVSREVERILSAGGHPAETVRRGALTGLHHDDDEAFLPDISAPLKKTLAGWTMLEQSNRAAIWAGLGVKPAAWDVVNMVDRRIREDEVRCLAGDDYRTLWDAASQNDGAEPLGIAIEAWDPIHARTAFMNRHMQLMGPT